jgi:predicted regulator of Ras-like GTPase activity (Roadblock/LC7/MglB family)
VTERVDRLSAELKPYRRRPGVQAAMLISKDGFVVVADAADEIDCEAVAAQVGGIIDIGARLAGELGQSTTRFISAELESLNVVLAPFNDELMLVLVADPSALALSYTLQPAEE